MTQTPDQVNNNHSVQDHQGFLDDTLPVTQREAQHFEDILPQPPPLALHLEPG